MENGLRGGKTEPAPLLSSGDQKLNVEHLLPQKWMKAWPLPHEADENAGLRRDNALHKLGNLTLTTTKLNSSLSNNPWNEKKVDIRRHSLLRLTTDSVLSPPPTLVGWTPESWSAEWDEQRIEERTLYLAQLALQFWPRPEEPLPPATA